MSIRGLYVFIVMVLSKAHTETVEMVVFGQLGGDIILPMTGSDKDKYVHWKAAGKLVLSRNRYGMVSLAEGDQLKGRLSLSEPLHALIITKAKKEDFQTSFSCELTDSTVQLSTTIYTLYTVTVTVIKAAQLAGDTLILGCTIQESGRSTEISWLHPQGKALDLDSRVQGARGPHLKVTPVSGQDSGEWVCVVTYMGKEAHARTTVTIVDLSPTEPVYTSVTQPSLDIPCNFASKLSWKELLDMNIQGGSWTFIPSLASSLPQADPRKLYSLSMVPKPTWTKFNSTDLLISDLQADGPRDLSLRRTRVMKEDRGQYTCAVDFRRFPLKKTVQVEVLEILMSPGSELLIGQQINLNCSLGYALPPDMSIKWIPPKQSSGSLGPPLHNPVLTLQEARDMDRGRWGCELWRNTTRLTSAVITLKIERAPVDVWLLVTICAAAFIFLLLLVLTVILIKRHKQRRTMPMCHRKKLCRCKDPKPKGFYRT